MLNMDHFVMANGQAPSHGFQVSIGTIVSLFFYEQLLQTDFSALDIDALVNRINVEAIERLKAVGAPVHPSDIDLSREQMRATIIRSQQIRRRYTIFDVAVRMGTMEEWADRLMNTYFA